MVTASQPKEAAKKVEAMEEVDKPLVMTDLSKPTPISMPMPKSIIEPIYEDDFYDDGGHDYTLHPDYRCDYKRKLYARGARCNYSRYGDTQAV